MSFFFYFAENRENSLVYNLILHQSSTTFEIDENMHEKKRKRINKYINKIGLDGVVKINNKRELEAKYTHFLFSDNIFMT